MCFRSESKAASVTDHAKGVKTPVAVNIGQPPAAVDERRRTRDDGAAKVSPPFQELPMSASATLTLDTHFNVGPIDPRIYGGFLEHLGRAVYGGVYDPGNSLSDANGFRKDVLHALR